MPRPPTCSPWLCALLATALTGCDDFLAFDTLRCGNGVIEPAADEDCDGLPGGSPFACGPPGTPAACRLVCGDGVGCPEGWRCGGDGVCAAGAGRFERPIVTRLDGESVALGDVDGDGRLDVVTHQRQALGVAYGRGDGAFDVVQPTPVPTAPLLPAVGDADGDGRADAALLSGAGLLVLRGTESRTLEAVAAPVDAAVTPGDLPVDSTPLQIVGVHAAPPYTIAEALYVFRVADAVRFSVLGKALDAAVEAELPGSGRPAIRAVPRVDAPDALLLTFAGHPTVYGLTLSCADDACALSIDARLTLPDGGLASPSGAFAADLDQDGWLDVLVQADGERAVWIGWGGPEGWSPPETRVRLGMAPPGGERMIPSLGAVADVVGDARPDLIARGTVFAVVGEPRAPRLERAFVTRRPLRDPGAADLDDDGAVDVYGVVEQSLEFALARDDGLFVEVSSGLADVERVVHGDLDGDRRTDLVVSRTDGQVQVLFGQPGGGFAEPVAVGRFALRAPLAVARLQIGMGADAADDLLLSADGAHYRFAGSPQRAIAAAIPQAARPVGVALGRFGDGITGFIAGRTQRLLRADAVLTPAGLTAREPALAPIATDDCVEDARAGSGLLRVVDLDRDGVDEVLHVDRSEVEGEAVDTFQLVEVDADGARCRGVAVLDDARLTRFVASAALDDGGGLTLVALRAPQGASPGGPEPPEWFVWNPGDPDGPLRLPAADEVEHAAGVELPGGRALIVVSDGGLHRARREGDALFLDPIDDAPRGVLDSRAGDVDGDGLDDLVLKTDASVLVYRQATCSARQAWDGACVRREAW